MTVFPELLTVGLHVYAEDVADDWGDPEPSWANPITRTVYGWASPSLTETVDAGRNPTEIALEVYASTASLGDVHEGDRMTVNGELYEVDGGAQNYDFGPFGFAPGVRVNLKRVEG